MKNSERHDYLMYRMNKADEAYDTAKLLADHGKWNAAVNRLYFAVYHAVSGLLVKYDIQSKTHSGVKTKFFQHFIKDQRISKDFGKLYSDLFDWRQKGDYGDFFDFSEEDVQPLLIPTRKFIDEVKKLAEEE